MRTGRIKSAQNDGGFANSINFPPHLSDSAPVLRSALSFLIIGLHRRFERDPENLQTVDQLRERRQVWECIWRVSPHRLYSEFAVSDPPYPDQHHRHPGIAAVRVM